MSDKTPSDFILEPREKNVYLELDDIPTRSAGGIYLSQEQSTPSRIGTILSCGPEAVLYPPGTRVIISSISGEPLYLWQYGILDGKWRVIHETNILGKVIKE
jgi:co-chaperonin GroES (HSP10)